MSFLDLQEVAKAKRERDIRLGKIPSAIVLKFPDRTVQPSAPPPVIEQQREPVVVPIVEAVIPKIEKVEVKKYPSLEAIIKAVALYYNVSRIDILSPRREAALVYARHVVCYLARELTLLAYPTIGRLLNRDHTSVLHGAQKITRLRLTDEKLAQDLLNLRSLLGDA